MAASAALPDAAPTNWVDRFAPAPLRPWLKLGRFDRPTGVWLLMLPGWQGIALADAMRGIWPDPALLALILAGAVAMRAAGCAYNDVVDRDLDRKVARTAGRPVASGQIGVRAALGFAAACSLAGLAVLLCLGAPAIVLGVGSLALVAAYPFMKRITWWPQAWLGLAFNWGALVGFAAAMRGWPGLPDLLLYAGGVAWTLGYDTIYAVQDLEDDALAGVKSSARRLGRWTAWAVMGFYVLAVGAVLAAGWRAQVGPAFWPLAGLYAYVLLRQPRRLRLADPARALSLFNGNALAGLLLFAALAAGAWRAFGL